MEDPALTRSLTLIKVFAAAVLAATIPQTSAAQTAASTASPAGDALAAPTASAPTAAEESLLPPEEALVFARKNGYRVAQMNGETMYCRRDRVTGSRVRSEERCYTRAQITRIAEAARRLLDDQTNRMMQPREGG
jgi:hypothetical protein